TLGGLESFATAINASGQVVGWSDLPGGKGFHAFLHDGVRMRDIGPAGLNTVATGINASGQVVGNVSGGGVTPDRAFLYSGGKFSLLDDLAPRPGHLISAAINDDGDIASTRVDGTAWLLTPGATQPQGAPEPSAVVLAAAGLLI